MPRISILAALLVLTACASTAEVDPDTALVGKGLDMAVAIYGPWQQKLVLSGRPTYIWRRELIEADARYYCELTVETGFRQIVSSGQMQGYPRACQLFAVTYDNKK